MRRAAKPITDGHPLDAVLATARRSLERLENIRDYSCVFAKRERIEGELSEREYLALKIRHRPFPSAAMA